MREGIAGGVAVLCSVLCVGCTRQSYELEMEVDSGRLHRRLIVRGTDDQPPSQQELERLAAAYGRAVIVHEDGRREVEGTFSGMLPDDIGGAGHFRHWTTSLGSLTYYSERFRGSDELATRLEERLQAVDQLVDLAMDWVGQEANDPELAEQIGNKLDDGIRRDLKDVILLMSAHSATSRDDAEGPRNLALLARCVQYALEHDYLELEQLPALRQGGPQAAAVLKEVTARRFGLADFDALLQRFPALADQEAFEDSLSRLAMQSERYAEIVESLQGSDDRLAPDDALEQLAVRAIGYEFAGHDELQVRFRSSRAPFATNGIWTENGWLEYTAQLQLPDGVTQQILPPLLFAAWSEPDVAFQQKHFGRTILKERALADYVLWREALSDAQGAQWQAFLKGLSPSDDIAKLLDEFRFDESAAPDRGGETSDVGRARDLIKAGLLND